MPDLDEVINGLVDVKAFLQARADMAVGDGKMLLFSWQKAVGDAMELLEKLRPRVLTRKEAEAACRTGEHLSEEERISLEEEYPLYIEFRDEDDYRLHWRNRIDLHGWAFRSYGVLYRCWTARPSEKQRKEVPWDA